MSLTSEFNNMKHLMDSEKTISIDFSDRTTDKYPYNGGNFNLNSEKEQGYYDLFNNSRKYKNKSHSTKESDSIDKTSDKHVYNGGSFGLTSEKDQGYYDLFNSSKEFKNKSHDLQKSINKRKQLGSYESNDGNIYHNDLNTTTDKHHKNHNNYNSTTEKKHNKSNTSDTTDNNIQYGAEDYDSLQRNFEMISKKANKYGEYLTQVTENMSGGEKKKRQLGEAMKLIQDIAKSLKTSEKYPDVKYKDFLRIGKMMVQDAKTKLGVSITNDQVKKEAMDLLSKADYYVKKYKEENKTLSDGSKKKSKEESKTLSGGVKNKSKKENKKIDNYFDEKWSNNNIFMLNRSKIY